MSIEGLVWPGIPGQRGQVLLSLLYQLEQSQWWSAEKLQSQQFRQLDALLSHARTTIPYYSEVLDKAGFDGSVPLTQDAWNRIPILDRKQVQADPASLMSSSAPPDHGEVSEVKSSGSTGIPVVVSKTQLCQRFWEAINLRDHLWHRRDLSGKMSVIRTYHGKCLYPDGGHSPAWSPAIASVSPSGPCSMLTIDSKVHEQVEWLQRENPEYLVTYPSNLNALIHFGNEHGLKLPNLKQVRTMSEVLDPRVRKACTDSWGVGIADMYSCEETGYIALQCAEHGRYHVQSETSLVEVVDESGQPCSPGQVGRVVVTPLHNFAMPLIRYAVGDLAEVGEQCPCGRGLPVLARIVGRVRNMLTLPNGDELYPDYEGFLDGLDAIVQFQIVRTDTESLTVNLVTPMRLSIDQEAGLTQRVQERFKYPFNVSFAYLNEILRGPGGKFHDYVPLAV